MGWFVRNSALLLVLKMISVATVALCTAFAQGRTALPMAKEALNSVRPITRKRK
jgi:hypothetical protein